MYCFLLFPITEVGVCLRDPYSVFPFFHFACFIHHFVESKNLPSFAIIACHLVLCLLPYVTFILIRIWLAADSTTMTKTMSDLWAYRSNAILNLAVTLLPWSVLFFNIVVSYKSSAVIAAFYTALGGICSVVLCIVLGQLESIGILPVWGGEHALQKWQDGFSGLALAAFIPLFHAFIHRSQD